MLLVAWWFIQNYLFVEHFYPASACALRATRHVRHPASGFWRGCMPLALSPKIGPILLKDRFDRQITDLRVSVTDRCNFKCFYCRTPHGVHFAKRESLLTYEEIERLAGIFLELGVTKIRLTGGEPLLRRNLELLAGKLSTLEGLQDLALTTNGFDFFKRAHKFKEAGLRRVTISLDSLKQDRFREITGYAGYDDVLRSITIAKELKLEQLLLKY